MLKIIMFIVDKKNKRVSPVPTRTFKDEGLKERYDLQEWIANHPNIFGEDLLIIQKEFSGFDKTNEQLDLLALDKEGRLVIIENKTDDSKKDVVWQALKYGAYCSTLTKPQIISIYQNYLNKYDKGNDAKEKISDFFDGADIEKMVLNAGESQRFILVAGKFRDEVTSTALWLIGNGINIQCFKVALFSLKNNLLLDVSKIIPTPDAEDYMIRMSSKNIEEKQTVEKTSKSEKLYRKFWEKTLETFKEKRISTFDNISPSKNHWISGATGVRDCSYPLIFLKNGVRVEFYIDRASKEENKKIYDFIEKHKKDLHKRFDYKLKWDRLDKKKACRISYSQKFDSYNEENWDEMIEWLAKHFQDFKKNMTPIINKPDFPKFK